MKTILAGIYLSSYFYVNVKIEFYFASNGCNSSVAVDDFYVNLVIHNDEGEVEYFKCFKSQLAEFEKSDVELGDSLVSKNEKLFLKYADIFQKVVKAHLKVSSDPDQDDLLIKLEKI